MKAYAKSIICYPKLIKKISFLFLNVKYYLMQVVFGISTKQKITYALQNLSAIFTTPLGNFLNVTLLC